MEMAKTKKTVQTRRQTRSTARVASGDTDSIYVLKLVLYLIIGAQWIRITRGSMTIPLPVGLLVGVLFARTERFSLDRKIGYAILLMSMFIGFWLPIGIEILL